MRRSIFMSLVLLVGLSFGLFNSSCRQAQQTETEVETEVGTEMETETEMEMETEVEADMEMEADSAM